MGYTCADGHDGVPKQRVYSAVILWIGMVTFVATMACRVGLFLSKLPISCSYESGEYIVFTWSLYKHPYVRAYKRFIMAFPACALLGGLIYVTVSVRNAGYVLRWFISICPLIAIGTYGAIQLYTEAPSILNSGGAEFRSIRFNRSWLAMGMETNESFVTQ